MNPFTRLTERIHARHDAAAQAQGLTVVRMPGGRRQISHPDLPELLEARRRKVISRGLDAADRAMLDPATQAVLDATAQRMCDNSRIRRRPTRPIRPAADGDGLARAA